MGKVYCVECKHYKRDGYSDYYSKCGISPLQISSKGSATERPTYRRAFCHDANKDNNCDRFYQAGKFQVFANKRPTSALP